MYIYNNAIVYNRMISCDDNVTESQVRKPKMYICNQCVYVVCVTLRVKPRPGSTASVLRCWNVHQRLSIITHFHGIPSLGETLKIATGKERERADHTTYSMRYRPGHKGTYLLTKHIRIHTAMTFFIESL